MANITLVAFVYGGVTPITHDCIVRDLISGDKSHHNIKYTTHWNDALISRCRSMVATRFLERTEDDVLVMIDHDLSWNPGDLWRIATKAIETNGIVGAMVAKRTIGEGIASRFAQNMKSLKLPPDDMLHEAFYVGSAFTAYPRKVIEDISKKIPKLSQGFYPFFMPAFVPHTDEDKKDTMDFMSEDWGFCRLALDAGFKCYLDAWPFVVHHGHYGFSVMDAFNGPNYKIIQNENANSKEVQNIATDIEANVNV